MDTLQNFLLIIITCDNSSRSVKNYLLLPKRLLVLLNDENWNHKLRVLTLIVQINIFNLHQHILKLLFSSFEKWWAEPSITSKNNNGNNYGKEYFLNWLRKISTIIHTEIFFSSPLQRLREIYLESSSFRRCHRFL